MSLKTSEKAEARARALALDTELEMVALTFPKQKAEVTRERLDRVFREALEFKRDQIAHQQSKPPFDVEENRLINAAMEQVYGLFSRTGSLHVSETQWERTLGDPTITESEKSLFLRLAREYRFETPDVALPPLPDGQRQRYPVDPRFVLLALKNAGLKDTRENRTIVASVMASAYRQAFRQANEDLLGGLGEVLPEDMIGDLVPSPAPEPTAHPPAPAAGLEINTAQPPRDVSTKRTYREYQTFDPDLIDLKMSEVAKVAIETLSSSGDWQASAQRNAKVIADIFIEENGDLLMSEVETKHVRAVRARLDVMPTVWGKCREDRAGGMKAIFARGEALKSKRDAAQSDAERDALPKVGFEATTINRHMLTLKQLFDFVRDLEDGEGVNTHVKPRASFAKVTLKDRRKRNTRKPVPAAHELHKLLSSPLHLGCASPEDRFRPGDVVIHDGGYWMPLILAIYGSRSNEFCTLPLTHVYDKEPIPFFRIREGNTQKVKTAATNRDLPVSPLLIGLGFFDYVEALRKKGETRLFPELNLTGEPARKVFMDDVFKPLMLHAFPNGTSAKMCDKDIDTQSIRKFLTTYLRKAEPKIDKGIRQAFFGHQRETTLEGIYEDDPSVEELLPCVLRSQELIKHLQAFPLRLR